MQAVNVFSVVVWVTATPAGTALAVASTLTVVDRPVMIFENGNRLVAEATTLTAFNVPPL